MNPANHEMADDMAEHALLTHQGWTKVCSGPCNQGRSACPCPQACEREDEGMGAVVWPLGLLAVAAFLAGLAYFIARVLA